MMLCQHKKSMVPIHVPIQRFETNNPYKAYGETKVYQKSNGLGIRYSEDLDMTELSMHQKSGSDNVFKPVKKNKIKDRAETQESDELDLKVIANVHAQKNKMDAFGVERDIFDSSSLNALPQLNWGLNKMRNNHENNDRVVLVGDQPLTEEDRALIEALK